MLQVARRLLKRKDGSKLRSSGGAENYNSPFTAKNSAINFHHDITFKSKQKIVKISLQSNGYASF